jgi:hypothetical protein
LNRNTYIMPGQGVNHRSREIEYAGLHSRPRANRLIVQENIVPAENPIDILDIGGLVVVDSVVGENPEQK